MEGQVNSYTGMNKDMGRDSIPNNLYIDALDIRITTTTGESMGSFTNMEGNEESFTIPIEGGPVPFGLWTADSPEIIGYATIRNRIILFVADNSDTKGWIYEVKYNTANRRILPGYPRLIYYNDSLNFSKAWPIEALGRYESDCIQRVYWTDYNNFFRSINIESELADLIATTPGGLDIVPDVEFNQPLLKLVSGGGNILSGEYQVAYRLITADGKQTLVSPPSNLIHAVRSDELGTQSAVYVGEASTVVDTGKSLTIEVDTSGYTNFAQIEFLILYYEVYNTTPSATAVEIQSLDNSGIATFIYTGNEGEAYPIELLEFTSKNIAFKTPKTITQKDNYLVAANIKGSTVKLEDLLGPGETFSALTRRYNSAGATPFPIGGGNDQDDLDNAFNVSTSSGGFGYNSDAHWDQDWHDTRQYRYQSDLTTLGGQGPNISYKFHLEPMSVDGDTQPGFNNISNVLQSYDSHDLNDGYGVYTNNSFPTFASPYLSGLLRGYKRGEVYRFGIIFYTNKGEASFVEYIGDIKFPDISEEDSVNNLSGTPYFPLSQKDPANNDLTIAYSLGIEFTLDFTSCPSLLNNITSYQIVRVQRTINDRKRLAQGIIKNCHKVPIGPPPGSTLFDFEVNNSSEVLHLIEDFPHENATGSPPDFPIGNNRRLHSIGALIDHNWLNGTSLDPAPPVYSLSYATTGIPTYVQGPNTDAGPLPAGYRIISRYLGFYTPEVSFGISDTISALTNLGNNLSILGTGVYLAYGDATDTIEDTTIEKDLSDAGSTNYDLAQRARDYRYKTRVVEPIYHNRVTNIRKLANSKYFKMDEESGLSNLFRTTQVTWDNYYIRNYFAMDSYYSGSFATDLNLPPAPGVSSVSKSGSNILIRTVRYTDDPLTGQLIPFANRAPADWLFSTGQLYNDTTGTFVPGLESIDNTYGEEDKLLIADITAIRDEQYGGYTQPALESNVFIIASPIINKSNLTPKVFGGDTFVNMTTLQTSMVDLDTNLFELNVSNNPKYYSTSISRTELYIMESSINQDLQVGSNLKTGVSYEVAGIGDPPQEILRQEFNNVIESGLLKRMYGYNYVFSTEDIEVSFFIAPADAASLCEPINDTRAFLSNVKANNQIIDAWTQFPVDSFYDVDDYGPINRIINYRDNVYFLQDRATGVYAINRAAVTTADDGTPTELGTKDGFSKHNYISKENGSIHQWAVKKTDKGIYFFDAINRKIMILGGTQGGGAGNTPLSELKGIHSFVQLLPDGTFLRKEDGGDNPILGKGVHIGKDGINDEVIFTFLGSKNSFKTVQIDTEYFIGDIVLIQLIPVTILVIITSESFITSSDLNDAKQEIIDNSEPYDPDFDWRVTNQSLVFDELLQSFSTRLSQTPTIWIDNNDTLLSPNSQTEGSENVLYIHNIGNYGEFYGDIKECQLTLVINPKVDFNKVLRFLEFNSIVRDKSKIIDRAATITGFQIQTEYQDSGFIPYSPERFKRRFDKWRLKLPRDINSINKKGRFRSTYFIVTLYFDNLDNKQLIMNHLLSYYDIQVY